ncbi:MAG: hypothetical protein ACKO0W_07145 [Planctomycetota bacterium]
MSIEPNSIGAAGFPIARTSPEFRQRAYAATSADELYALFRDAES